MRKMLFILICALIATAPGQAQTARPASATTPATRAASNSEATLVSEAWAALARGDVKAATSKVAELKQRAPHGTNSLWLDIEINLVNGGPAAALDGYDQWLGGRATEEPLALRRIATAILFEGMKASTPAIRMTAVAALAADGDAAAIEVLQTRSSAGSLGDAAALAAAGNAAGVKLVSAALTAQAPNKIALAEALGASKDRSAIPALEAMLSDPRPEHQAAAATALGELGAREDIGKLQAMLKVPRPLPFVTVAVAGALLKLDDMSGYDALQTWMRSETPAMRASAAKAMAVRPDANWAATVRNLTSDSDPLVRLDAAKLLAAQDPDLARATLAQLAQDSNPTIRDMANQAATTTLPADLAQLKAFLRQPEAVRVPAAQRLLEMTR